MGDVVKKVTNAVGLTDDTGAAIQANRHNIDAKAFINPNSQADRQAALAQALMQQGRSSQQYSQGQQARGSQQGLLEQYLRQASGQEPSIAQQQLQMATDRNIQSQMGAMAANKGLGGALAARTIANQAAQANQQAAGDSAVLRLQEQQAAQQAASNLASNMRSADMTGTNVADTTGLNQQGLAQQLSEADRAAKMQEQALRSGQGQAYSQMAGDATSKQADRFGNMLSSAASAAAMFSDKKLKTDIKDGSKDIKSFLDAISSKSYKYKDSDKGEGKHVSPMAQDLEKTALGKSMVEDTPEGKVVNYGKGFGAMLAAQADLNKRMKKLEKGDK